MIYGNKKLMTSLWLRKTKYEVIKHVQHCTITLYQCIHCTVMIHSFPHPQDFLNLLSGQCGNQFCKSCQNIPAKHFP